MIETLESIFEEIKTSQETSFGEGINTDINSNNYKLIYPIMSNLLKKYDQLNQFLDNRDVYKAEGLWLDYLLSNFNFIRKQDSKASATWTTLDSTPGTEINPGDLEVEDSLGHKFVNVTGGTVGVDNSLNLTVVALEYGAEYNVDAETLTNINTPISGLGSGTNLEKASGGQSRESDFEFRTRFLSGRAGTAYWNIDGIYKSLKELSGVTSVFVTENDQNITVDSLPPHSIKVVVQGGDNEDIAKTIFEKSDTAIEKVGNTTVEVTDLQGELRQIKFQRPTEIDIDYQFTVTGTVDTSTLTDEIKNYIDNAPIRATISTYQCIRYLEQSVNLNSVDNLNIEFRRTGDTSWLNSLTLGIEETGNGVLVT